MIITKRKMGTNESVSTRHSNVTRIVLKLIESFNQMHGFAVRRVGFANAFFALEDCVASHKETLLRQPCLGSGAPIARQEGSCGAIGAVNFRHGIIFARVSSPTPALEPGD